MESVDSAICYTQSPNKTIKMSDKAIEATINIEETKNKFDDIPIATQTSHNQDETKELNRSVEIGSNLSIKPENISVTKKSPRAESILPIIKEEVKQEQDIESISPINGPEMHVEIREPSPVPENSKDIETDEEKMIKSKLNLDPNDGDIELEPFLDPLLKNAGSKPELLNDYSHIEGANSLFAGV